VQASHPERREVYYQGEVQGVGFRYTAQRLAGNHEVTGYVKNLPDGRVLLVAEGQPPELDQFLNSVSQAMRHCVESTCQTTHPATGEFTHFGIRH
jgi:acylphosphatase